MTLPGTPTVSLPNAIPGRQSAALSLSKGLRLIDYFKQTFRRSLPREARRDSFPSRPFRSVVAFHSLSYRFHCSLFVDLPPVCACVEGIHPGVLTASGHLPCRDKRGNFVIKVG